MCEINIFSKDMDWLAKQYHFHVYNWEYSQYYQCFSTELTILLSLSFELYIVPGTTNCRFKIISVSFFPSFRTNEYYHRRTVCFHFKIYSFHSCQQYTKNITAIITITTSTITTSKKWQNEISIRTILFSKFTLISGANESQKLIMAEERNNN